jgi:hypothetical protein
VDIAGVALIAGLVYMMYRRKWLALPKLDYARPDRTPDDPDYDRSFYRREDWAFLWTLILIAITGYFLEAARLVWLQDDPIVWDYRWWSPVGTVTAYFLQGIGVGPEGGGGFRMGLWWFHGLLAFVFIGLIPYTKVKHVFTAMGSLMAVDPDAKRRLPMADIDQDTIGFTHLADFTSLPTIRCRAPTCRRSRSRSSARAST